MCWGLVLFISKKLKYKRNIALLPQMLYYGSLTQHGEEYE